MAEETVREHVRRLALQAKGASAGLAQASGEARAAALLAMAAALRAREADILAANARDMEAARQAGTKESLLDRLYLDAGRVEDMASALEDVAAASRSLGRGAGGAPAGKRHPACAHERAARAWWPWCTRRART